MREAPRRANPIVSVPTWHCRWMTSLPVRSPNRSISWASFGACGGRVLEKVLVVVVVASHVQLGAVVPVAFIVRKPLCVAVRFGHFVIVCRRIVGEACPSVPRSYRVDVGACRA